MLGILKQKTIIKVLLVTLPIILAVLVHNALMVRKLENLCGEVLGLSYLEFSNLLSDAGVNWSGQFKASRIDNNRQFSVFQVGWNSCIVNYDGVKITYSNIVWF